MKKISLFILLTVLVTGITFAQRMNVATYVEQTTIGPKIGTAFGYRFQNIIEVGGFYQKTADRLPVEVEGHPIRYEKEFYGAYFSYPVFTYRRTGVRLNVRSGITNGENFIITPSLQMGYRLYRNVMVTAGIGARSFQPTYLAAFSMGINP